MLETCAAIKPHAFSFTKPASRVCVGDVLVTHNRHSLVSGVRLRDAQVLIETRDGGVFTYGRQDAVQVI